MALIFIDGFDHYDPQALDASGSPYLARGKASYLSPQAIRIPGRRPSSYALRLPSGPGGGYVIDLGSVHDSIIVGAAVRIPQLVHGTFLFGAFNFNFMEYAYHYITLESYGNISVITGYPYSSSTNYDLTLQHLSWHYVEMLIERNRIEARVDCVPVARILRPKIRSKVRTVSIGAAPSSYCPVTVDLDDLYIADTSGTVNNTFLGDVRVDTLKAKASGALNQWTAVPAGMQDWQAVRDDDDATAVSTAAAGRVHTFDIGALPVMSTPAIHGAQINLLARKTSPADAKIRAVVRSGVHMASGADIALQEHFSWRTAMFERNPDGNMQWTERALCAAEYGAQSA